jgi:hypothetical protein
LFTPGCYGTGVGCELDNLELAIQSITDNS